MSKMDEICKLKVDKNTMNMDENLFLFHILSVHNFKYLK